MTISVGIIIWVPNSNNLNKNHPGKLEIYPYLSKETKQMWHQTEEYTIPLIISATGVVPKHLHSQRALAGLELLPNTYIGMQKSVLTHTCSLTRQFLNIQ